MIHHRHNDRSEMTGDTRHEHHSWQADASRAAYSRDNGHYHSNHPYSHSRHLPGLEIGHGHGHDRGHGHGHDQARHHYYSRHSDTPPKHHSGFHSRHHGDNTQYQSHDRHHDRHHDRRQPADSTEPPQSHRDPVRGGPAEMAKIVAQHAAEMGLSKNATIAAVAAMLQESGGDPNKPGDFGKRDHKPHSFGLFQLNFHGGEGTENHITPQQALDPHTNARIALKYFKQNQHLTSNPGELAQMAQRPSDRNYVSHVNNWVGAAKRLLGFT